jgi:type IV pilus assembly protein PilA
MEAVVRSTRVVIVCALLAGVAAGCGKSKYESMAAVASGLSMASTVKTFVSAFYDETGRLPSSNAEAHVDGVPLSGPYVSSVEIHPKGVVVVTFTGDSNIRGKTLELAPTAYGASLSWSCRGGSIGAQYRPEPCR